MAFWQFITFIVLIGSLLGYASVISRRLGRADARLNRIEEALLAKTRSFELADALAAEAKPVVAGAQERHGGHLTIRDLRQLSSRTSVGSGEVLTTPGEQLCAHGTPSLTVNPVPPSLQNSDAPATSSELLNLLTVGAVSGDPTATSLQGGDAQATISGQQGPTVYPPPSNDSVADKNRDLLLFLSAQRRRRRARLGY